MDWSWEGRLEPGVAPWASLEAAEVTCEALPAPSSQLAFPPTLGCQHHGQDSSPVLGRRDLFRIQAKQKAGQFLSPGRRETVMIPPLGVTAPLVLYHIGSGRLQGDKAKEAPSREQGRNCLGQSREHWLGAQRWVLVFECYLPHSDPTCPQW